MVTPVYDLISKTSLGLQAVNNAQNQKARHRELILDVKPSATTAFLKFIDPQFTCYNIPLGETENSEKDQSTKNNNVLIPIIPLCYTTPDCDPKNAKSPRAGGYLYIYVGDYLWRELEVFKDGKFRDVNLHQYQGKDVRPSTVEQDSRILVPHMVEGTVNTISMCYSEIQWSWARLNSLGGMDPDDFRLDVDKPPPLASDMDISKATAAKNRASRMQELNLSGYLTGFPSMAATGNKARVENSNNPTSTLYYLSLHKKSEIPLVYLHDPLGIALSNVNAYHNKHSELVNVVNYVKMHVHFKSGVIAYHAFFNEALWEEQMAPGAGSSDLLDDDDGADFEQTDAMSTVFRKAASDIDLAYLEDSTLGVTVRQILRKKIRELKTTHVEWLQGKFNDQDISITNSDFVSVNDAMLDYAELPPPYYVALWSAMHALIHLLNHDPSRLDAAIDLNKNRDQVPRADDPGCLYMDSLLDPAHPLHATLFPKKTDVDEFKKDYDISGKKAEQPDGSGDFRPVAYAENFKTQINKPETNMKHLDNAIKMADKTLADFMLAFKSQWLESFVKNSTVKADVLVRLMKAANLPGSKGIHILPQSAAIPDNVAILSGQVSVLTQLMKASNNSYMSDTQKTGFVEVFDPETKKVVGYIDPRQLPNYKGMPTQISKMQWDDLFAKIDNGNATARVQLIAVSSNSEFAKDWTVSFRADISETIEVDKTPKGIRFGAKYLPPIVAVFEVFNLISATVELNKKGIIKNFTKFGLSALGLMHASLTASVTLIGEARTADIMQGKLAQIGKRMGTMTNKPHLEGNFKQFGKKMIVGEFKVLEFEIKILGAAGAGLTGIGALMSGWDMYDSLLADDDDAAAAYAVQAVALVGLAITGLVEAGAVFLGMGPIGWAFLAVGILAGIMAAIFTDTPIEKWAKHGPFAKQVADRMTAELANITTDKTGQEITRPKTAIETLEALMSLLMQPNITLKNDTKSTGLIVEMKAPGFQRGKSTLDIKCGIVTRTRYHRGTSQWSDTTVLTPTRTENILDNNKIAIGIRYYYALPTTAGVYRASAKGVHITADQIYIPMKKNVEHKIPIKKGEPGYRTGRASIGNFTKKTQLDIQWVHSKAVQFSVS